MRRYAMLVVIAVIAARAAGEGHVSAATGPRLTAKERQQRNHIDDAWDVRLPVKAGRHQLPRLQRFPSARSAARKSSRSSRIT